MTSRSVTAGTGAVAVHLSTSRAQRIAFAAGTTVVAIAAAAACFPGARRYAFWQDEVASARVIAQPNATGMLQHVAHGESTPPLWYALAWLAHRAGLGIVDLRLLSVLAVAGLAAGAAVAARRIVPGWAALLAGAAIATGYQFDFHGRELRAYALAALLTLALAVAAERSSALLATVVAAGSLTHYFFLFSVVALVLWRRRLWRAVAVGLVPLAVWSPILVMQYDRHRFGFIGRFDLRTVSGTYWATFARGAPHEQPAHTLAPLVLLGAVIAGAVVLARASEVGRLWALLAVAPVALAAVLWLLGARIYDVRNLIGAGPFAAVAVAALIARAPRAVQPVAAVAIAVLLVIGLARANRVHPVAYDRIAAALTAEGWQPGDAIVVYGDAYALWGPLEWYLPHHPTLVLRRDDRRRSAFAVADRGPIWGRVSTAAAETRFVRQTLVARLDGAHRPVGRMLVTPKARR